MIPMTPDVSYRAPKGAKRHGKRTKIEPKGAKGEPTATKREPKGAEMERKGAEREPRSAKKEPTVDQNASKNRCVDQVSKRSPKWCAASLSLGAIWGHFGTKWLNTDMEYHKIASQKFRMRLMNNQNWLGRLIVLYSEGKKKRVF